MNTIIELIYSYQVDDYSEYVADQSCNGGRYAYSEHITIYKFDNRYFRLVDKESSSDFNMYNKYFVKEVGCIVQTDLSLDKEEVSITEIAEEISANEVMASINIDSIHIDRDGVNRIYCSPSSMLKRTAKLV